ncbi:RGCVC family protein [Saccharothrix saharensis]|uniref:RGCVC family protein n=1 Tax=Saccharothrix saharensis TaxID=571190 RepID=UPI00369E495E
MNHVMPIVESTAPAGATDATENRQCAVCPHPWSSHDRIAMRFCTATINGKYGRGCVCGS